MIYTIKPSCCLVLLVRLINVSLYDEQKGIHRENYII